MSNVTKPSATKDCLKLTSTPPKCVNCKGEHPANYKGCPQFQQHLLYVLTSSQHQRQTRNRKPTPSPSHPYSKFPSLRTPPPQTRPSQTWAQIAAQTPNSWNQQPLSSTVDSIKSILAMFDFHKLSTLLRSLVLQLQTTNDPITKIVAIVDTVLACLSSSS